MSREYQLIVEAADPLAEITVHDGTFKCVARGVGRYQGDLADGLYELRARLGGAVGEKLISLDRDMSVEFDSAAFASPIPVARTPAGDSSYQAAIAKAFAQPKRLCGGSGILLVVRDRPGDEPSASYPPPSPAQGLKLSGGHASPPVDLGECAHADLASQVPVAAIYLGVNPGVYRLRLALPDGTARERTLVASPGWRTECFMVRRRIREHPLPDLDQGAVSIGRLDAPFTPDDKRLQLAEAARDALVMHRSVTKAAAEALRVVKFQDPMLGLLVGHLLWRDKPEAKERRFGIKDVLDIVIEELVRLLGPDHPDVRAVALGTTHDDRQSPITDMPMLRASWDRIVQHSLARPDLVPVDSPAGISSSQVLPSAPWLVWESADASSRRADSKMAALRSYVDHLAASAPARGGEFYLRPPTAALDEEDREELVHSLGVPASVLDDMLSRLGGG